MSELLPLTVVQLMGGPADGLVYTVQDLRPTIYVATPAALPMTPGDPADQMNISFTQREYHLRKNDAGEPVKNDRGEVLYDLVS